LNGWRVIGKAIADGAVITHMNGPIREQAGSQLRDTRAPSGKRGAIRLHDGQDICISRSGDAWKRADLCIRHG
jgi:hypothetical protein